MIEIALDAQGCALLMEIVREKAPQFSRFISARCAVTAQEGVIGDIRLLLVNELAVSGFDGDYRPNMRGAVIERLIDRLFVR